MDFEDIAGMCASLSLIEREGPVRKLKENLETAAMLRLSSSLVGKILTRKMVNREAFMRVIGRIWQVRMGVEIESMTGNIFSFHFNDKEDRRKVIAGAPWTFDNALLVLEEPEVTGLADDCIRKFMRVRVRIDIDKPLKRCLRVDVMGDGVETVMLLRYERLPNICFKCGKIGHTTNECLEEERILVISGVGKPLFGDRMKATRSLRKKKKKKKNFREQRGTPFIPDYPSNNISSLGTSGEVTISKPTLAEALEFGQKEAQKVVMVDAPMTDVVKQMVKWDFGNSTSINAINADAINAINATMTLNEVYVTTIDKHRQEKQLDPYVFQ
ncbi:hypothetical protein EZV62_006114 [Acer yangbiense]|uniref:CCHC-type domain-containing protein n=1 Tax=Acer yangbiense TaxID=1000413 RepID=A0A5C7IQ12_9ROSI|nr:hypothetical protein EZV62_006114 [Acer yangbiense]